MKWFKNTYLKCFQGANSHGQLGQGSSSEQCEKPQAVIDTWYDGIQDIACNGGHTLMITNEGKLYACGWNHRRQLGFDVENCQTFSRVWDLSGITFRNICAGWDSSAAISEKDILYFWGSNVYGQLGLPCDDFPKFVKPIQLELKVKDVSMGMRHTTLLDFNGNVWTSGCGKRGQLGLGDDLIHSDKFQKIANLNNISNIACGQYHTLAWSNKDKVLYVWGDNTYGQLGSDVSCLKTFNPVESNVLGNFKDQVSEIYAGWTHSAAFLNNGKAVYWGRNNYGQLGHTEVDKKINIVEFTGKYIDILKVLT